MTIQETLKEIQSILNRTPYTKEEIALLWKAEEKDWEPETIIALGAAYEYLHVVQNDPLYQNIRGKYLEELDRLKEYYSVH